MIQLLLTLQLKLKTLQLMLTLQLLLTLLQLRLNSKHRTVNKIRTTSIEVVLFFCVSSTETDSGLTHIGAC